MQACDVAMVFSDILHEDIIKEFAISDHRLSGVGTVDGLASWRQLLVLAEHQTSCAYYHYQHSQFLSLLCDRILILRIRAFPSPLDHCSCSCLIAGCWCCWCRWGAGGAPRCLLLAASSFHSHRPGGLSSCYPHPSPQPSPAYSAAQTQMLLLVWGCSCLLLLSAASSTPPPFAFCSSSSSI